MTRLTRLVCLLGMVLLVGACSSDKPGCVSVEGEIQHLGRSAICLSYYVGEHVLAYDTLYSNESGFFRFEVTGTDEINPITLYFQDFNYWTTIFAKGGDIIRITGDIELVDLLTITGGPVNDDLTRFKQDIHELYVERQRIIDGKYQQGGETVEVRLAEINLALKRKAKEFILEHPASFASLVLIQDFFYQDYDPNTGELLHLLEGEAKNNHLAERLEQGMAAW